MRASERVERSEEVRRGKAFAVKRDGVAAFELDPDIGGRVGRGLRIERA